jgi:hypothetical protein
MILSVTKLAIVPGELLGRSEKARVRGGPLGCDGIQGSEDQNPSAATLRSLGIPDHSSAAVSSLAFDLRGFRV